MNLKYLFFLICRLVYINQSFAQDASGSKTNLVYETVEHEPEFKGGMTAFYQFLGKNIIYPVNARRRKVTGKVFIQFVVERDGSLTDVQAIRSPDDELATEAVRVVKQSPKWTPGTQHGRLVRVQYTVPINFTLNGK